MEDHHDPPPSPPPPPTKTYKLTATSISYSKPTSINCTSSLGLPPTFLLKPCTTTLPPTYILQDISFTAYPSQILAIMGPSGAGKSTLLDILAARTSPTTGSLVLNSHPICPSYYRKLSAYVPQHDAYLPFLTISETFTFTARLLFPTASRKQVSAVVSDLLAELRLGHLSNSWCASNGLSGGERRRVSIGLSLLHDPGILLLDEPTSGLDSGSAFNVLQTLKSIAESRHRTVVLSIHQPSFKILSTIHKILLLSKGKVIHHGSVSSLENHLEFHGFTVPPQLNALEHAMEVLNQLPESKPIRKNPPSDHDHCSSNHAVEKTRKMRYKSSRVHEILTLSRRFWKIIYRTKQLLLTNTLEALIVGFVLVYFLVGLCATWLSFGYFVLVIWVIVLMANSFVLFLSSVAPTYIAGTSLVTVLLAGFFLFSGYFIGRESMPKYWVFMHYLSMYKYALDALLINEYSCLATKCFVRYEESKSCMVTGHDVLEKRGLHEGQRWNNVYVLVGFSVFYRVLCLLVLIKRVARTKR
ncbi:hypothetical protein Cgig2_005093 [Carnegiea gigantea]|uniref:ABC transporter domain-containing protein n=1 Tax=Carnegiea gigantea TaxID=171969 RepID=A0A9Q1QSD6_9CARY|nr:hypothetical protein Cgig2_005093 [Carnegiea gigantea]